MSLLYSGILADRPLVHMLRDAVYTDVVFRLPDGTTVGAHRVFLSVASQVFQDMLVGLPRSDLAEVTVSDDPASFRRLLTYIYTDENPEELSELNTLELCRLCVTATKYRVHSLAASCRRAFQRLCREAQGTISNILESWRVTCEHGENELRLYIEGILVRETEQFVMGKKWPEIGADNMILLYESGDLNASEDLLCWGALRWCKSNAQTSEEAAALFCQMFALRLEARWLSPACHIADCLPAVRCPEFVALRTNWSAAANSNKGKRVTMTRESRSEVQHVTLRKTGLIGQDYVNVWQNKGFYIAKQFSKAAYFVLSGRRYLVWCILAQCITTRSCTLNFYFLGRNNASVEDAQWLMEEIDSGRAVFFYTYNAKLREGQRRTGYGHVSDFSFRVGDEVYSRQAIGCRMRLEDIRSFEINVSIARGTNVSVHLVPYQTFVVEKASAKFGTGEKTCVEAAPIDLFPPEGDEETPERRLEDKFCYSILPEGNFSQVSSLCEAGIDQLIMRLDLPTLATSGAKKLLATREMRCVQSFVNSCVYSEEEISVDRRSVFHCVTNLFMGKKTTLAVCRFNKETQVIDYCGKVTLRTPVKLLPPMEEPLQETVTKMAATGRNSPVYINRTVFNSLVDVGVSVFRLHREMNLDLVDTDIIVVQDGDELGPADDYDAFVEDRLAGLAGVKFIGREQQVATDSENLSMDQYTRLRRQMLNK